MKAAGTAQKSGRSHHNTGSVASSTTRDVDMTGLALEDAQQSGTIIRL